jgi:hypothetical protein
MLSGKCLSAVDNSTVDNLNRAMRTSLYGDSYDNVLTVDPLPLDNFLLLIEVNE